MDGMLIFGGISFLMSLVVPAALIFIAFKIHQISNQLKETNSFLKKINEKDI
ncbi:MAG: hypothetical protein K9L17_06550 [Clostridiales bacterium]|nr:hypothetical protein [Clostridiales bacterium]MCF8022332.1 hypothetical protein [Clostridiales bacterium]